MSISSPFLWINGKGCLQLQAVDTQFHSRLGRVALIYSFHLRIVSPDKARIVSPLSSDTRPFPASIAPLPPPPQSQRSATISRLPGWCEERAALIQRNQSKSSKSVDRFPERDRRYRPYGGVRAEKPIVG